MFNERSSTGISTILRLNVLLQHSLNIMVLLDEAVKQLQVDLWTLRKVTTKSCEQYLAERVKTISKLATVHLMFSSSFDS